MFYIPQFQSYSWLAHVFTGREGGHSSEELTSLNLKYPHDTQSEADQAVWKNRQKISNTLGITPENWVACQQVHGIKIHHVTAADKGKGAQRYTEGYAGYDGLMTREKDIPLLVLTADCLPIAVVDPRQEAIGAVHSGWRGTQQKILQVLIDAMETEFGSQRKDLEVAIGPGIGFQSFEVGPEVIDAFPLLEKHPELYQSKINGKYLLDLQGVNRILAQEAGILKKHIYTLPHCTYTDERFYSYRREKGKTGRQGLVLALKG